jgi:hypothetical protein
VIVSGGNIDPARFCELLSSHGSPLQFSRGGD